MFNKKVEVVGTPEIQILTSLDVSEKVLSVRGGVRMKKDWKKPKLLVITKGTAAERVLQGCKGSGYDAGPSASETPPCIWNGESCVGCLNAPV